MAEYHTAIVERARGEQRGASRRFGSRSFLRPMPLLTRSPRSLASLTLSSFVLKYSPTSSNDASAQLAGQSEPTSTEGAARHFKEAGVDEEERGAARAEGAPAALLARARGAGRTDVRQRAEDISRGCVVLRVSVRGGTGVARERRRCRR